MNFLYTLGSSSDLQLQKSLLNLKNLPKLLDIKCK